MQNTLRREFRLKHFWLGHHKPEDFYLAQWRWHPAIYIIYRLVMASYSVSGFLVLMITVGSGRSFAYLTILTYLVLCLYQLSALFTSVFGFISGRGATGTSPSGAILVKASLELDKRRDTALPNLGFSDGDSKISRDNGSEVSNTNTNQSNVSESVEDFTDRTTWYMKLTWLLGNILYVFGIVVTIVYFTAVHKGGTNYHDLNMHAFNTVQILIDLFVVARPVRLLHAIYPIAYGMCYIIFSAIFWSQDKVNNVLYQNVLDWNKPGTTAVVVVVLALVGIPLLQVILYALYHLRLYLFRHIYGSS